LQDTLCVIHIIVFKDADDNIDPAVVIAREISDCHALNRGVRDKDAYTVRDARFRFEFAGRQIADAED
tara:strand:- start:578 stop:781 length:204 start_codon:yes stop_codon:yes gene_type:complete